MDSNEEARENDDNSSHVSESDETSLRAGTTETDAVSNDNEVINTTSSNGTTEREQSEDTNDENEISIRNPSLLRKRLRPRQNSSSSSSESTQHASDYINTSDDVSSTSEEELDEIAPISPNPPEDFTWTEFLCKRPLTRNYTSVRWQDQRRLGCRPPVTDTGSVFRKIVQRSSLMIGKWRLSHQLNHHHGCVNAANFNTSGSLIASGSDDLHIAVWKWQTKSIISEFDSGHLGNVFQTKFLPLSSDLHIISCARDGQVRIAQLSSSGECRSTRRLGRHGGSAHKLALDPANPHSFYSCGEDAKVYLFDVREENPTKLFTAKERGSKVAIYSIDANPMSEYQFLTSGRDAFVRVYDKRNCSVPADSSEDRPTHKFCPPHINSIVFIIAQ